MIKLDQRVAAQVTARRLQVLKYRGSGFGRNEYPYVIAEDGVHILPSSAVELVQQPPGRTGVERHPWAATRCWGEATGAAPPSWSAGRPDRQEHPGEFGPPGVSPGAKKLSSSRSRSQKAPSSPTCSARALTCGPPCRRRPSVFSLPCPRRWGSRTSVPRPPRDQGVPAAPGRARFAVGHVAHGHRAGRLEYAVRLLHACKDERCSPASSLTRSPGLGRKMSRRLRHLVPGGQRRAVALRRKRPRAPPYAAGAEDARRGRLEIGSTSTASPITALRYWAHTAAMTAPGLARPAGRGGQGDKPKNGASGRGKAR